MPEDKPLILIVEDDNDLARFNVRLLARLGYAAHIVYTLAEARAFIDHNRPDLYVLDIGLPDGSGLTLCEELKLKSDAPILFLTGKTETPDKIAGLGAGGDYYLTKPYDKEEFIAVVQSLMRRANQTREKIAGASVIEKGSLVLKLDERKAFVDGRDAELTMREFGVLLLLVQHDEEELSGETIYSNVWGAPMNNDSNALRLVISRVKKKLDEENASDFAILTRYGGGYSFVKL